MMVSSSTHSHDRPSQRGTPGSGAASGTTLVRPGSANPECQWQVPVPESVAPPPLEGTKLQPQEPSERGIWSTPNVLAMPLTLFAAGVGRIAKELRPPGPATN